MIAKIAKAAAAGALLFSTPAMASPGGEEGPERSGVISPETAADSSLDNEFTELFASWESTDAAAPASISAPMSASYDAVPTSRAVVQNISISVPARMPLDDARLTSGYGTRNHPILQRRARHHGVDLAAPTGTPVYATADGTVEMAQWYSSYGNYVQIGHGGDMETRYAHLSSYTVQPGEQVRMGDLIGYVGSTGRSTGPHLHYEVRISNESVNPIPYMTAQLDTDNSANAARGGD